MQLVANVLLQVGILGVPCAFLVLYLVATLHQITCSTWFWCTTFYLMYLVLGTLCTWCTLYLVYLKHLMTWFLCTEGLERLSDVRHDLVQHPEYFFMHTYTMILLI